MEPRGFTACSGNCVTPERKKGRMSISYILPNNTVPYWGGIVVYGNNIVLSPTNVMLNQINIISTRDKSVLT